MTYRCKDCGKTLDQSDSSTHQEKCTPRNVPELVDENNRLRGVLATVRSKLFALDGRVCLAEDARDIYDDVRDTLAGMLIGGELESETGSETKWPPVKRDAAGHEHGCPTSFNPPGGCSCVPRVDEPATQRRGEDPR